MDQNDRDRQLNELHLLQSMFPDEFIGPPDMADVHRAQTLTFKVRADRM